MIWELSSVHPGGLGSGQSYCHCREIEAVELKRNTKSFLVIDPRLWNVLLAKIAVMDCPQTFKRVLTEWFLKRLDGPPVAGYQRSDDNCLLSVFRSSV